MAELNDRLWSETVDPKSGVAAVKIANIADIGFPAAAPEICHRFRVKTTKTGL